MDRLCDKRQMIEPDNTCTCWRALAKTTKISEDQSGTWFGFRV